MTMQKSTPLPHSDSADGSSKVMQVSSLLSVDEMEAMELRGLDKLKVRLQDKRTAALKT
jgi:hypothetical protein